MAYHQPYQITAFHSCDREVGLRVLNGKEQLRPSDNAWDWLGPGIYFWEQNPGRALQYACESANNIQKNAKRIHQPFVIGAVIELGNCLNLLSPYSADIIREAHQLTVDAFKKAGQPLPTNKGANRLLDCTVMRAVHATREAGGLTKYDTVRCAFPEGTAIYEGSNFHDRLHIEIAVLNPEKIKGYFLPRPIEEFNPFLDVNFKP